MSITHVSDRPGLEDDCDERVAVESGRPPMGWTASSSGGTTESVGGGMPTTRRLAHSVLVAIAFVTSMNSSGRGSARRAVWVRAFFELAIAASVFVVYRGGRLVTSDSVASAAANAERVLDLQRQLIGNMELNVQRWILDVPGAIDVLNHYYVFVHFPATTAFLVWAFARRRDHYPEIRNWFVGVTLTAMVIHMAYPLAPPRMLDGYVDTLREYGPNIYPEDPSRSLANQFAAMPSLHFGWALMVALAIIMITTSRYRWWWLAHPAVTLLAIVATANHYLLDAAIAAALALIVGVLVLRRSERSDPVVPIVGVHIEPVRPSAATSRRAHPRCAVDHGQRATPAAHSPTVGRTRVSCREDDSLPAV